MIAWCDLETTGLEKNAPAAGILEIAFVITDDDLNELQSIQLVCKPVASIHDWVEMLHPRVLEMHTKNGLIEDVKKMGMRRYEAEELLVDWLTPTIKDLKGKVPLAGNSVHFDGTWLEHWMPLVREFFSHRTIDMTTFGLTTERWAKKIREGRPREDENSKHRAMSDIRHSIECAKYYRAQLFDRLLDKKRGSYPLVIVESPYAPKAKKPVGCGCVCDIGNFNSPECYYCYEDATWREELQTNIHYARVAMKDCLMRGEAPYASHLLYTQPGVLDDTIPEERMHGIVAGFEWRQVAEKTVVYTDLGISKGMQYGIDDAMKRGCPIEYRTLPNWRK
jgi:oligoribonuclease (3'-5' exoribonuclease)